MGQPIVSSNLTASAKFNPARGFNFARIPSEARGSTKPSYNVVMKKILLLGLFLILAGAGWYLHAAGFLANFSSPQGEWRTYTTDSFKINYPANWIAEPLQEGIEFSPEGWSREEEGSHAPLYVRVIDTQTLVRNLDVYEKGVTTLEEYLRAYQEFKDAYGLSYRSVHFMNRPAYWVLPYGIPGSEGGEIWMEQGGKVYAISLPDDFKDSGGPSLDLSQVSDLLRPSIESFTFIE